MIQKAGSRRLLSTYLNYQLIAKNVDKAISTVESQATVKRDTDYYKANIGKVTSVDGFIKNDRLFRYAMKAFGLEDMTYAKAFMKKVLNEGIRDSGSFANKLNDKRYYEFAKAFDFERLGAQATTYNRAQDDAPTNFGSQVLLAPQQKGFGYVEDETTYYLSNIGSVKSVDDLMGNTRLLSYAMTAFGLDGSEEPASRVRTMLEGGVSDPASPANSLPDKRYANFVTAFDFAKFGNQTTAQAAVQTTVPQDFVASSGLTVLKASADYTKGETDYYAANIGKVTSIDDLMADKRLLRVAMSAYGLSADDEDTTKIRTMLQGGVTDPASPANMLADKSYASFVAAFDFTTYGTGTAARDAVQKDTLNLYASKSALGLVKLDPDYVKAETAYFNANVVNLDSIDDLMADKRLLTFALTAYGLDPNTQTPETIRTMLAGGVKDPKSPANQLTDKNYAAFVSAFDFADYGETATTRADAQQPAVDKYMRQTLEENAGETNEGVRLALYFDRKAGDGAITSFYDVLADTALAKVVRTALRLPDSFATADIDKQVAYFESKLDISTFTDKTKLSTFLKRFTSLYDIDNSSAATTSPISMLYSQSAGYGVSADTLLSIAKLGR